MDRNVCLDPTMFELVGTRAVVTGVSQGIGQAIAVALARAGANVAGIYNSEPAGAAETARAVRAFGRQALIIEGDTGDLEQVEALRDRATTAWGGIDIWVNNAARLLVRPFLETTSDDWHDLLATNLHGYIHGCRAAATHMAAHNGGVIVNVSSVTDIQPVAGLAAYIAAKGAVVGLTRALALEFAPQRIRVNAIAPGATDTPLNKSVYTPDVREMYERRIALGRIASPDEIADAVLFLASGGSRYITGQELLVDGGLTINGNVGHALRPN